MRKVIRPPGASKKAWGWSFTRYADDKRRLVECFSKDGGFCSVHRHLHQDNIFCIESGSLRITIGEEGQSVWIRAGEVYSVPALIVHSFQALAETFFLEVYLGRGNYKPLEKDIERFSEGGMKNG